MCKTFSNICCVMLVLLISLLCVACDVDKQLDAPLIGPYENFIADIATSVTNKERDRIFRDTITPPGNPMNEVPYVPGTYYFRGVLRLEYFRGSLFCVIRSTSNNNYYLTDDGSIYLMRLNNPLLKEFAVGDTLVVTAKPIMLLDSLSLATYHILPNNMFK